MSVKKSYETEGVCTSQIDIELDGRKIKEVNFHSGCPGNLLGITKLVENRDINEVIELLEGTPCGTKETSCPDQLAQALKNIVASKACLV